MSKVIINWRPGVTKLHNIKTLDMAELYQKGFFLLLGGSSCTSNLTYERLIPIYLGTSFDQPLGKVLETYLEDSGCVYRFLQNNNDMDLLFICGILQQPDAEIISPDNISKVKDIIVDHIEPYCNDMPTKITNRGLCKTVVLPNLGMFANSKSSFMGYKLWPQIRSGFDLCQNPGFFKGIIKKRTPWM